MPRAGARVACAIPQLRCIISFFKDGETHLEMFTLFTARVRLPGSFRIHPLRLKGLSFVIQNLIRPGYLQRSWSNNSEP